MQSEKHHRAFFLVPPKVHLLDMSGAAHIMYEATNDGAAIESIFISLKNDQEKSSAGISFRDLIHFSHFTLCENDWLFIPGLEMDLIQDTAFKKENQEFNTWLNAQHANGAKICSVCTGAFLLARAGLLDGKACTTHWKYLEAFRKEFPKTRLLNDRLFVEDHRIYTSAGVSSGIDLALFLLEEHFGPVFATRIAKEVVVYLRRSESDPQLSVFLQYRNHLDQRVHQAQDILAQHLGQKITIDDIAEKVNMSPRNLTRLFKKTTGITIGDYHDKLRVERAVQLLSDGAKVETVSAACGLQSTNQLRALLRKYRAALPHELQSL